MEVPSAVSIHAAAPVHVGRRSAEFFSGGLRISAHVYSVSGDPESGPRPGVVICNGMRGVKEWIVPPFGKAFAAAGYVAVAFDHRGMGESEGPVGRVIPSEQVEDIRSAISYLESLPEVDPDRIVLWGTSFGGANVISAAALDPRVKAVVVQVAFGDWGRVMRHTLPATKREALIADIKADRQQRVATGISALTSPDRMLDNEESRAAKQRSAVSVGARPELLFTYESVERSLECRPEEVVHLIAPRPLLVIGSRNDGVVPFSESESLYARAGEPKKLVAMDIGHYDICEPPGSDDSARIALEFLRPVVFGDDRQPSNTEE